MPERHLAAKSERGEYLAFLGRLSPERGAHVAISLARRARLPLRLAARIPAFWAGDDRSDGGTPVIAFRRGSVPEVIDDGVSGFVVDNEDEALAAIARVNGLDRRRVRAAFEERFTAARMARD